MKHLLLFSQLLLTLPLLAQESRLLDLHRMVVKGGEVSEFSAAIRQLHEFNRRFGSQRYSTMWRSTVGQINEFHRVAELKDFAELDTPEALPPLSSAQEVERFTTAQRHRHYLLESSRSIEQIIEGSRIRKSSTMPRMLEVYEFWVDDNQIQEFVTLIKSDLIPAAQKSGIGYFQVTRPLLGASRRFFRVYSALNSYSEIQSAPMLRKILGERAEIFFKKIQPLATDSRVEIRVYLPALSYLPEEPSAKKPTEAQKQ